MHTTSILTTVAALTSVGSAAVLPKSAVDAYVGDLRTFTQFGCSENNQGVGTFTHSMTSSCNLYAESFGSLYIHMNPGWHFKAHMKSDCSDPGTTIETTTPGGIAAITCNNQTSHLGPWVAYSVYPSTD